MLFALHDRAEFFDHARIFQALCRGRAVEQEVIVHKEEQQLARLTPDLLATAHGIRHQRALVRVRFGVRGSTRIMKQEGEVMLVELLLPILHRAAEFIEHVDGAQRVLVCRVAMEKLVLHEAGERAELWHIAAEESHSMHLPQHACDIAFLREDRLEALADGLVVSVALIHQAEAVLHELE